MKCACQYMSSDDSNLASYRILRPVTGSVALAIKSCSASSGLCSAASSCDDTLSFSGTASLASVDGTLFGLLPPWPASSVCGVTLRRDRDDVLSPRARERGKGTSAAATKLMSLLKPSIAGPSRALLWLAVIAFAARGCVWVRGKKTRRCGNRSDSRKPPPQTRTRLAFKQL